MPYPPLRWLGDLGHLGADARFTRRVLILAAASFGLLLLGEITALYLEIRSADAQHEVVRVANLRRVARDLLVAMQDAEISQRRYLLGEDEASLESHRAAVASVRTIFDRLRSLAIDDRDQHAKVAALRPAVEHALSELERGVMFARQGQRQAALLTIRTDEGRESMEKVRREATQLYEAQFARLTGGQARVAAMRRTLLWLIAVDLVGAVVLVVLLARSILHYVDRLRVRAEELELEARRRNETEAALRQAQKLEAVGRLTGGIAHDFNNLLHVVRVAISILQRRVRTSDPEAGEFVEAARRATDSAAGLTQSLVAFSRQHPLDPKPIDPNRLVAGMMDLLRRTLGRHITVETDLAKDTSWVVADANQLESALLNLALNARDAMPQRGTLTIAAGNRQLNIADLDAGMAPGEYVSVAVSDTGTGMTRETVTKAFEPFFTTKPAGEGSGLGLAQVHGFIKQSGGQIRIRTEIGTGTTVELFLPRCHGDENLQATAGTKVEPSP